VVNFFRFMVQELREIMAELGFKTINEMVGQVDCLQVKENINHWKFSRLDLSPILYKEPSSPYMPLYCAEEQDHGLTEVLDWKLLEAAKPAIQEFPIDLGIKVKAEFKIKNTDRTVGTILSNEITKVYRGEGLPDDTIHLKFTGTAGQSFAAFNTKGLTLELEGDANDYCGKGLSGARLIIYPPKDATYTPEDNIIIGNVAFYGATSGEAFIRGKAGERFCVRNSGAHVVVESVGDHGCEYMTGGRVVVLGETGRNFAAGMSGGIAYVYDVKGKFGINCNKEMVDLDPCDVNDKNELFTMLQKHYEYTGSTIAKFILEDLNNQLKNFVKVFPKDYKKALLQKASGVKVKTEK
jgi:glutamate synthase (NADPH/NADH) large chain